jgi:hypothetical protein
MRQIHLLIQAGKPGMRVNSLWKGWECRQGRKSQARRAIATGPSLMGTFRIGVLEKRFCSLTHLLQGAWLINLETLLPLGPLKPVHKGIVVGPMWRANVRLQQEAQQEPTQWGGQIPT